MCSRWLAEYRQHARTSERPAREASGPGRTLVEVLRDLFRPRRPQVREAEVVAFPAEAARDAKEPGRETSRAA